MRFREIRDLLPGLLAHLRFGFSIGDAFGFSVLAGRAPVNSG